MNDLQVDRSVESKHAAAADRCVPSGSTACSSERRRQQPGEVQEAPFADLSVHRGPRLMQMAVFDRFRLVMSVIPGDQRLVLDGTPELVGWLGWLETNGRRVGRCRTRVF